MRIHPQGDLITVPPAIPTPETGRTTRDVAAVVFRRKRIVLALFCGALGTAAAGTVWVRRVVDPPRWTSGLKFVVRRDRVDAVVTTAERSVPGIAGTVTPQEVLAEVELLKSADVVERLAEQAGAPVERVQRGLTAEPVAAGRNTTNFISVRYSSPDREEVLRVLGRLPEVYLEKHLSVNRRPRVAEYFQGQAAAYDDSLRRAEEELAEFEKRISESSPSGTRQTLAEVEQQRFETDAALREAESTAAELDRLWSATPAEIRRARAAAPSPHLERLKAELLDLESERARATRYRDLQRLEARMLEIQKTITGQASGGQEQSEPNPARVALEEQRNRTRLALAGLRARRGALLEAAQRLREQAAAEKLRTAENSARLAQLRRRVKSAEGDAQFYHKKYAEAREAELLDRNRVVNVFLAEGPRPPVRAERRSSWFYLGLGGVLAMAAATAGGFAVEMLDHSVHTPRQLERLTSLPVLASIPDSKRE